MRKVAEVLSLGTLVVVLSGTACMAQSWPRWAEEAFGRRFQHEFRREYQYEPRRETPERRSDLQEREREADVRQGGARPTITPVAPPVIAFHHDFPADSIVIDVGARKLFYVLANQRAYEYRIGVGREGFNWTGNETISRKQAWPDWHPPAEMRERDPSLPERMTGGIKNPLGAMALYLGDTLYRIHGTNDAASIGRAESSGCFRMLNSAVLHLASLTQTGTPVAVVKSLPSGQEVSRAPAPALAAVEPEPPRSAAPSPPSQATPARGPATDYRSLRESMLQTQ